MDWYRAKHTIGMCLQRTGRQRAQYLKKHGIFRHLGEHCMVMFRKIPLYPKLISMGNNVWIATGVTFVLHDAIHHMLNNCIEEKQFQEFIGCVEIKDNVFIGSNSTVLPNVTIGPNVIVGAGTLVNKDLSEGVYAGVPARYICSFETFVEKRSHIPDMHIERSKENLPESSVEAFWEMHNKERMKENDE